LAVARVATFATNLIAACAHWTGATALFFIYILLVIA
jgi:hypothetical protein